VTEPRDLTEHDLARRFTELAERYETVAALDLSPEPPAGRAQPGSRVPPGVQEILDDDEIRRAINALDDWAAFIAHILVDEHDVIARSPSTPGRLRLAAEHASVFVVPRDAAESPDVTWDRWMALGTQDDLYEHLRTMRRIAGRAVRRIRTGHRCVTGCGGQYVSPLGEGDRTETALRCDRCGHEVAFDVWSRWPRARVQWITVEHAAKMLGTSVAAVKQRKRRERWRTIGTGREVRYSVEDVRHSGGMDDTQDTADLPAGSVI